MEPTTMPTFDALTQKVYSTLSWLTYYKNIWVRNVVAATIDVEDDIARKAVDADEEVTLADGRVGPVKARLEERKMELERRLALVASIDRIIADHTKDGNIDARWTPEALKVAEDMLPEKKEPVAVKVVVGVAKKPTEEGAKPEILASKEFLANAQGQADQEQVQVFTDKVKAEKGLTDETMQVLFMTAETAATMGVTPEPADAGEEPSPEAKV